MRPFQNDCTHSKSHLNTYLSESQMRNMHPYGARMQAKCDDEATNAYFKNL